MKTLTLMAFAAFLAIPSADRADTPDQSSTPAGAPSGAAATPDRVGFPGDYRSGFKLLGMSGSNDGTQILTAYANALAASVTAASRLPFPDGSVIVMEFATALRDGEGKLLRDAKGALLRGEVVRVDVMRRERGYGEAYGESRAGEWEFASYRADGSPIVPPADAARCAACHRKAGASSDFVYRMNAGRSP